MVKNKRIQTQKRLLEHTVLKCHLKDAVLGSLQLQLYGGRLFQAAAGQWVTQSWTAVSKLQ